MSNLISIKAFRGYGGPSISDDDSECISSTINTLMTLIVPNEEALTKDRFILRLA